MNEKKRKKKCICRVIRRVILETCGGIYLGWLKCKDCGGII